MMNNLTFYAKQQLQTMSSTELMAHSHSLSIPADHNWTKRQMIAVIDYYQQHSKKKQDSFLKGLSKKSTLRIMFMLTAVLAIIYSKLYTNCPTALCHSNVNFSGDYNDKNSDILVSDAVTSVMSEFAVAATETTQRSQARYNELKRSLTDLNDLYQTCQHSINEAEYVFSFVLLFELLID